MAPPAEGDPAPHGSMQQHIAAYAQPSTDLQRRPRTTALISQRPVSAQAQLGYQFIPMAAVHIDPDSIFGSTPGSIKDAMYPWAPVMLHKARPKSASVTAAAWKAYGSPKLKGQVRPAPAPAPAHPNMLSGQGPQPLVSHVPTVGTLGGGFSYPCRASPRRPQSAKPQQQRAWSAGTRHAPAELRAWHAQQQARLQGSMQADTMIPAAPQLIQPYTAAQQTIADSHAVANDHSRPPHTQPTDPSAHRTWCKMLHKSGISTAAATAVQHQKHSALSKQRPHSASRAMGPVPVGGAVAMVSGASSARLTSVQIGAAQQHGARYTPHVVAGHVRPQQEHVLPTSAQNDWAYSRVGATALARLQASIKLPMSAATHTGSPGRPLSASSDLSHLTLAGGHVAAGPSRKRPMSAMPRMNADRQAGGVGVRSSWPGAGLLAQQAEVLQGLMQQEGLLVSEQQPSSGLPVLLEAAESQGLLHNDSAVQEGTEGHELDEVVLEQVAGLQHAAAVYEQPCEPEDRHIPSDAGSCNADADIQAARHDEPIDMPRIPPPTSLQHDATAMIQPPFTGQANSQDGLEGHVVDAAQLVGARRLSSACSGNSNSSQRSLQRPFSARRPSGGHASALDLSRTSGQGNRHTNEPDAAADVIAVTVPAHDTHLQPVASAQHDQQGRLDDQSIHTRHSLSQGSRTSSSNSSGSRSSHSSLTRPTSAIRRNAQEAQPTHPPGLFSPPTLHTQTQDHECEAVVLGSPEYPRRPVSAISPRLAAVLQAGSTSQRQRSGQTSTLWQLGLADSPQQDGGLCVGVGHGDARAFDTMHTIAEQSSAAD